MSQRFPSKVVRTRESFESVRQFGATVALGRPPSLICCNTLRAKDLPEPHVCTALTTKGERF